MALANGRSSTRVIVGGQLSGGTYGLVEITESHGAGPPRHRHSAEEEALHVVLGTIEVELAGRRMVIDAGCCVLFPRDIEHAYRIVSESATILLIVTPAGVESMFYDEVWDGEHLEELIAVAAGFGIEVTGGPIEV